MDTPKYLKLWDGYITSGRDAGYPETKLAYFEDEHQLAKHPDQTNQVVYNVTLCLDAERIIQLARDELRRLSEQEQREKDELEFQRLRQKLGK